MSLLLFMKMTFNLVNMLCFINLLFFHVKYKKLNWKTGIHKPMKKYFAQDIIET